MWRKSFKSVMHLFIIVLMCSMARISLGLQSQQTGLDNTHSGVLLARQASLSECINGIYDSSCWDVLDLTGWLYVWYNSTPPCPPDVSGNCIAPDETWTDAFLRIAQNITGGPSCVDLYACQGDAPNSNQIRTDVTSTEAARYRYVCYNIYGKRGRSPGRNHSIVDSQNSCKLLFQ